MKEREPDEQTAWSLLFVVGFGVAAVGSLDLALMFYPPQWASLDWEFGTIGGFIEGLPLLTTGLGLMTAASAARGTRGRQWLLTIALLLLALVILGMATIFALDVPAALRAVSPVAKAGVTKAVFKTLAMGMIYAGLYAALGVWTWRRLRPSKGTGR